MNKTDSDNLNIVLVGMPGAGKSYIGDKLAKLLTHFSYVEIDSEIEKEAKMPISEIFEQYGEKHFREIETSIIKKFGAMKNHIISIGGGGFDTKENIDALQKNGLTFYLRAPIDDLYNRIKDETQRPLLNQENPIDVLKKLLKKREKNYLKANFIINTKEKQAYTILNDILEEYHGYVKQKTFS